MSLYITEDDLEEYNLEVEAHNSYKGPEGKCPCYWCREERDELMEDEQAQREEGDRLWHERAQRIEEENRRRTQTEKLFGGSKMSEAGQ